MKRPAFQFYPSDWRKDMALQSCSVAARGLWMDMLCIAHECEPYGHLTVNGKPMSAGQIGRHTGLTERECIRILAELEEAGVFSRTAEGAIYSRRMVTDEDIRNRRADGGKAGSEHGVKGAEHGVKGGRPRKERGDKKPPLEPPPSSSSSSSASALNTSLLPQAPAFPPENRLDPPPLSLVGSQPAQPNGLSDCPHQAVLALWAEVLPAMPQHNPTMWRGARADHLRARWRETAADKRWTSEADGLAYLRKLFAYVAQSAFLTGRVPPREPGRPPFQIELEWLVNPTNWARVIEGKYHQTEAA